MSEVGPSIPRCVLSRRLMCMSRFATELAGRKARRKAWDGLAEEMARAGWFDG